MAKVFFDEIKTKGRPKKLLNALGVETIRSLASIQCTDEEIASVLGCSVDLLTNRNNNEAFQEAKEVGQLSGKASLRRMQFKTAEAGNATMQIWLGKQYLGQKDKQDVTVDTEQDFVFNILPASNMPLEEYEGSGDEE
jgi:hypothetical protein